MMKNIFFISTLFLLSCAGNKTQQQATENVSEENISQQNDIPKDHFELTPETAHPRAKELLNEDFYWSPIEETGPFGNDAGWDAFYQFREWRMKNPATSPVDFVNELMTNWDIPRFDMYELNSRKIEAFITQKTAAPITSDDAVQTTKKYYHDMGMEISEDSIRQIMKNIGENMGGTYLLEQDNVIISVGFGQFALEGKIDEDIQKLTKIAIQRQLLPVLIDAYPPNYIPVRKKQLNKMLKVADKMNK